MMLHLITKFLRTKTQASDLSSSKSLCRNRAIPKLNLNSTDVFGVIRRTERSCLRWGLGFSSCAALCSYQCDLNFGVLGRDGISMSVGQNRNRCEVRDVESGVWKSSPECSESDVAEWVRGWPGRQGGCGPKSEQGEWSLRCRRGWQEELWRD